MLLALWNSISYSFLSWRLYAGSDTYTSMFQNIDNIENLFIIELHKVVPWKVLPYEVHSMKNADLRYNYLPHNPKPREHWQCCMLLFRHITKQTQDVTSHLIEKHMICTSLPRRHRACIAIDVGNTGWNRGVSALEMYDLSLVYPTMSWSICTTSFTLDKANAR